MSIYLHAGLMLFITLTAFGVLVTVWRFAKTGAFRSLPSAFARHGSSARPRVAPRRLRVEEVRQLDAKRRLVLVACDGLNVLLLTGGPADLVISRFPANARGDDRAEVPA